MNEIRKCTAAEIFDDPASAELFAENEAECANPLLGPTRPERNRYEAMEAIGLAHCFSFRDGGVLRGFACLLTAVVPHFGLSHATVESLFVKKAARSVAVWFAVRRALEDFARESGCGSIFYTAPVGSSLARILAHEDDLYRNTNLVFGRSLN
jgi:hypothetical protein